MKMAATEKMELGSSALRIHTLLTPYVKSRQEAAHIRRSLADNLDAQLDHNADSCLLDPISLVDETFNVKSASSYPRSLRREYLRALRANIRARQDYESLINLNSGTKPFASLDTSHLDVFLILVKQRQRNERLHILQNYLDKLARKFGEVLKIGRTIPEVSVLPRIPEDVISIAGHSNTTDAATTELKDLVYNLERATLRSKLELETEQHLLSQVKTVRHRRKSQGSGYEMKDTTALQALGRTHNELISWVEEELGKAGESSQNESVAELSHHSKEGKSINQYLAEIQRQYSKYIQARKLFLEAVSRPAPPDQPPVTDETLQSDLSMQSSGDFLPVQIISPYIGDLIMTSNEQKSLIQQKSHFTVTLAKHHKDALQAYDRLADESHLLPEYPMPSSQDSRNGSALTVAFAEDMSSKEIPITSHLAGAWTFAAERVQTSTRESVFKNIEDGASAVIESRQRISVLEELLGQNYLSPASHIKWNTGIDNDTDDIWIPDKTPKSRSVYNHVQGITDSDAAAGDIWSFLDGNLGAIKDGGSRMGYNNG